MISRLLACLAAAWLAFAPAAEASQATLVTPAAPLPMSGLASFLNSAFLSIGSQNSGTSAPANGTGGAAFAYEVWCNTTANPTVCNINDGTNWVEFGLLNTSTHAWSSALVAVNNSLSADVAMNNISNYFDGPSAAQGTAGTWFASGSVEVLDTAGSANFDCKLWDGTTVIDSGFGSSGGTSGIHFHLSGYLASPAANIRISCKDTSTTNGAIKFNESGSSKDSTISVIRIQ